MNRTVVAFRKPTESEKKFGYGCLHYREFEYARWMRADGTIKDWIIVDGHRWMR